MFSSGFRTKVLYTVFIAYMRAKYRAHPTIFGFITPIIFAELYKLRTFPLRNVPYACLVHPECLIYYVTEFCLGTGYQ